jgi:hypothetical protein
MDLFAPNHILELKKRLTQIAMPAGPLLGESGSGFEIQPISRTSPPAPVEIMIARLCPTR